jgi:Fe-S cluster biosynthesis and repair protein YggX
MKFSLLNPILVQNVPLTGKLDFLFDRSFTRSLDHRILQRAHSRAIISTKSMPDHIVLCAKLKKELPGLPEPPFDSELGKKIYDNVSQQAWGQWMEHCKMLLNEYRLNPARKQDQEVIITHMEQFFFGEGSARPAEYVPPTH